MNSKSPVGPMAPPVLQPAKRRSFGLINASEIVVDSFDVSRVGFNAFNKSDKTSIVFAKNIDAITINGQIAMGKSITLYPIPNLQFISLS